MRIKRDRIRFLFPLQPVLLNLFKHLHIRNPLKLVSMLTNTSIQDQTVAIFFEWATSELRDRFDPKSPQLCVAPSSFATCHFTPNAFISIITTDPIVRFIRCAPLLSDNKQICKSRSVSRRQHFTLHLPLLLYTLPGKIERALSVLCIQVIQHFHQLFTSGTRSAVVEQVELGHAG